MFRFPSPAHNNTDHQHHRSSPPQVTNSSRVNTETPTMKCESEEPSSSTADQNDFPLPNSFSCSQRKSHQRTKAMWDAAVSAINAYLQTDEDYVTSEEKKAFSSTIEQLRISAERLVSTLQQPLSPTHGHTDENLDQSREIEKPGHEESVSEERMVDLEWALEQERRKRKHLQEDFETFRSNMANVLTEHAQDIAELRSSLVPQKRKAVSSRTVSAAYTAVESTDLDTANPEPHRLKRLNIEGLNLDSFSWDLTLDRTQLIDPADGFVYLLPDYPDLKAMVLNTVKNLAPKPLSNRASSHKGLWQCLGTRVKGDGGVNRGTYVPPKEACVKCATARRFCIMFNIGTAPVNAETWLLPLPGVLRGDCGLGEEGYFRMVAA